MYEKYLEHILEIKIVEITSRRRLARCRCLPLLFEPQRSERRGGDHKQKLKIAAGRQDCEKAAAAAAAAYERS